MPDTNTKIMQYRCSVSSQQEADKIANGIALLESCIDALADLYSVMAYFRWEGKSIAQKYLPEGCSLIPAPDRYPGDQCILHWSFPGSSGRGGIVTIIHISYVHKNEYRYFVEDQKTHVQGWVDPEFLQNMEEGING